MSDSKDLEKKYSDGEFSYLYWPVSLNFEGCSELHCTAKFMGKVAVTEEQILQLIGDIPTFVDADLIDWQAEEWDTKNDGTVKVLRLTSYPGNMTEIHVALESVFEDQYPEFKPHITVPAAVWAKIKGDDMSPEYIGPAQMGLRIGALVLKSQGKFVAEIDTTPHGDEDVG